MRTGFKQQNAYMSVSTPLGADVLRLTAVHGEEGISELFHFDVEMDSADLGLDFSSIIGKGAAVTIKSAGGGKRYINGVVTRFVQTGGDLTFASYRAELRPWLWWLTLATDSRIFQEKSTPDIIEAVFGDLGFTDYRSQLSASYKPHSYCAQYQETTFDFLSRLMEEEGIFYYFAHEDGKHTLTLVDDSGAYQTLPNLSKARFHPTGRHEDDVVLRCALEQQAQRAPGAGDQGQAGQGRKRPGSARDRRQLPGRAARVDDLGTTAQARVQHRHRDLLGGGRAAVPRPARGRLEGSARRRCAGRLAALPRRAAGPRLRCRGLTARTMAARAAANLLVEGQPRRAAQLFTALGQGTSAPDPHRSRRGRAFGAFGDEATGRLSGLYSPMDLKSYNRWYDYSRARDEMFAATDTEFAPWYVARSDDKKRARLNIITHLLGKIPYKSVPQAKVKLPQRQKPGGYKEPDYPFKFIKERF